MVNLTDLCYTVIQKGYRRNIVCKDGVMEKKKVVVGMSGGVDSSVAAYLLKEQGFEVIGVTMQLWQGENSDAEDACCGLLAVEDARRVAEMLEIPHYVMNFKEEFQKSVVDYFVAEYCAGRTPNPCIACNRYIKWEALLNRSLAIGADYIATGHYARVEKLPNGRYSIRRAATAQKDQTYALYNLTQEQLSRTLFPVGDYEKAKIRQIAEEIGLKVAHKPDSQEICFVPDQDYAGFIERSVGKKLPEGNFVTPEGEIIGTHRGIIHYTVGQRKGLNLSLGYPVFVLAIRPETNEVVIGDGTQVYSECVTANRLNFMAEAAVADGMRAVGKIRYNHKGAPCRLYQREQDSLECIFDEPQRAVTPGQALVLYYGEHVLAGGTII